MDRVALNTRLYDPGQDRETGVRHGMSYPDSDGQDNDPGQDRETGHDGQDHKTMMAVME